MSKQWQIRRGTTAENNSFTGAIGEITMDTNTNGLRVHDGSTQGGFQIDTVVAFQKPTAVNNYTWYRKYASGWVEQGGYIANTGNEDVNVVLPVEMSNTYYDWFVGYSYNTTEGATYQQISIWNRTTTGFSIRRASNVAKSWTIRGIAA